MFSITTFALSLVAFPLALSAPMAPIAPLDAGTLLQNGQTAQALNSEFQNLTSGDVCTPGQTACISQAIALCVTGSWLTEICPSSQACFALPSVRDNGTFVACTSQAEALSIIDATGATGGIFSNSTNNNVSFPSLESSSTTTSSTTSAVFTTAITITLPSVTQTISPDAASSLLSSLLANGASPGSTVFPGTDIAPTTITVTNAIATPSQTGSFSITSPAATTIQLTAQIAASSTPTNTTPLPPADSGY